MAYIDAFYNELPKSLDKEVQIDYLKRLKNGESELRNVIVEHNLRLVVSIVIRKFSMTGHDVNDLVSVGTIGLIKAVDTYDCEKNANFATYSSTCITNEILMYMRKRRKAKNNVSLSDYKYTDKDGHSASVEDFTMDESVDIEGNYERREYLSLIRAEVDKIKKDNIRKIMYLEYGFDCEPLKQREISDVMGMSQSYVSRIIMRETERIGKNLAEKGLIEYSSKKEKKKVDRTYKYSASIYDQFKEYTKEEVDTVIGMLNEEELRLLHLRFGEDFSISNVKSKLVRGRDYNDYYNNVLPKMKALIKAYHDGTLKKGEVLLGKRPKYYKTVYQQYSKYTKEEVDTVISMLDDEELRLLHLRFGEDFNVPSEFSKLNGYDSKVYYNKVMPKMKSMLKALRDGTLKVEKKAVVTADDYARIIEFIDSHDLRSMFNSLDPKQAIILCLKLGYINNKAYSVKEIAIIMDAKELDIIKSIRYSATLYKDRFDSVINIDSTLNELKKEEMKLKKKA